MPSDRRSRRFRAVAWGLALAALAVGATAYLATGGYDVAADAPHHPATQAMLDRVRRASIAARAANLAPPADLMDPARITQGAGNYHAMCMGCHLAPGMEGTELSRGLYPAPPDLRRVTVEPAEAFWVIKHGIKASGMPAWGRSMGDDYLWNMVAFVRRLPSLSAAQYAELVAKSDGHSHGGGETGPHDHPAAEPARASPAAAREGAAGDATPAGAKAAAGDVHRHADGARHVHGGPDVPARPASAPAVEPTKPATPATPAKPVPDPAPAAPEAPAHDTHDHEH